MNFLALSSTIASVPKPGEARTVSVLIACTILLTLHRTFGSIEFAGRAFPGMTDFDAALIMYGAAFLLLGVTPALWLIAARERLSAFGVCAGDWKWGLRAVLVLLPVVTLCLLLPASTTAEIQAAFPQSRSAAGSLRGFLLLEIPRGALYYVPWEFFFRGFLLFSLRRSMGDWTAISVQMIPQCLWHIGMPVGEIVSSVGGGLLFGAIALRTRSIVWPLGLHYAIAVILDVLVIIRL